MNRWNAAIAAMLAATLAAGCHRHDDYDHKAPAAQDQSHNHGGDVSITHYTASTELFVEFPLLVKGEEASFAAHLTQLGDFKAVAEGRLAVVLSGGGQPEERAEAGVGDTPGIFRPALKPQFTGKRRLAFHLSVAGLTSVHDVGEVEVHASPPEAEAAAAKEKGQVREEGIKFTKEQQWKMDFASAPAGVRDIGESIAVTAVLRPRPSGEAQLAAPSPGLLRPGPGGFPHVGMKVAAGQVLVYVVPRLGGETDAASLRLAVERAKIEAEYASQERERLERLLSAEAIPEKRVQEARNRERVARAELQAAERRSATYQGDAGGIALKSPIAGTVVAVNSSPGAPVSDSQMVVHVAALDRLWLEARVPESEIGRVVSPAGAFFRPDGADEATVLRVGDNARLVAYGGLVDRETRTTPAILEFANPGGRLRAGMQLQARLYTGRSIKGVAVPASAVIDDGGRPVVFVQKEGESFERRIVEAGLRDGDWIAIRSGVAEGDRVVVKGAYQVRLAAAQPAAMGHGHAH
jgi:cobalt-zinc-cadmium efflux system membrane fusion protein